MCLHQVADHDDWLVLYPKPGVDLGHLRTTADIERMNRNAKTGHDCTARKSGVTSLVPVGVMVSVLAPLPTLMVNFWPAWISIS